MYELFIINVVMSIFAYVVFFIALASVPRLRADRNLFLITSTLIFFNTIGVEWLYKALEQYTYITIRSIIFKFIALIAMFILGYLLGTGIIWNSLCTAISLWIGYVFAAIIDGLT